MPSKYQLKQPFLRMHGENMAKNQRKCCQIAKIFVAITSGKAWKTWGIFFLVLCGHHTIAIASPSPPVDNTLIAVASASPPVDIVCHLFPNILFRSRRGKKVRSDHLFQVSLENSQSLHVLVQLVAVVRPVTLVLGAHFWFTAK